MAKSCTIEDTLEELTGKCHALWVLSGKETEEWNGDCCDCELIQGTFNCKRCILEEQIEENKKQIRTETTSTTQEK